MTSIWGRSSSRGAGCEVQEPTERVAEKSGREGDVQCSIETKTARKTVEEEIGPQGLHGSVTWRRRGQGMYDAYWRTASQTMKAIVLSAWTCVSRSRM